MSKKGYKLSEAHKRRISIGRLNSPILQAKKEETRKLRGLKRQARIEERQRQMEMWGNHFSPEARAKISQAKKGSIPWNKGVKAWNNGHRWDDTVRENISRGMTLCWQRRKQQINTKKWYWFVILPISGVTNILRLRYSIVMAP